jgi:NADH-ubiquinone oxidoreductase chain 6
MKDFIIEISFVITNRNLLTEFCEIAAIILSILSLTSVNPVYSVIGLILVFVFSSCYLLTQGIMFLGLSYLIIYVGAIAILFLFVVMMLSIKYWELSEFSVELTSHLPLAGIIAILLLFSLFAGLNFINSSFNGNQIFDYITIMDNSRKEFIFPTILYNNIIIGSQNLWDTQVSIETCNQISGLGYSLYTNLSLWLIIVGLILLLAMIGPIILCL